MEYPEVFISYSCSPNKFHSLFFRFANEALVQFPLKYVLLKYMLCEWRGNKTVVGTRGFETKGPSRNEVTWQLTQKKSMIPHLCLHSIRPQ